jgi:hippurate hydrolase
MASEDNFTIKIKGKGSHASSPNLGKDPLIIAAEIMLSLQTIVSRNANPILPAVVSCTELFTDGAHNAIPSNVTILGDTRSNAKVTQELIETRMQKIVKGLCEANDVDYDFSYTHEFGPTINWDECVDAVVGAATEVVGGANVNSNCEPWMGAEDFGRYLEKVPGCYFFLGSGSKGELIPLHNSQYDYNDNVLETGAKIFEKIVKMRLLQK